MSRRVLMVFMVLWLPLQGVVAAMMPFCKHAMTAGDHSSQIQEGNAVDHSRHTHRAPSDASTHAEHAEHPSGGSALVKLACDHCEACHLACATFIPAQHNAVSFALTHVYQPHFTSSYNLLAPEQLLHPPRRPSFA